MRMWLIDPKILCKNHLLGEHNELHKLVGAINKGKNLKGYYEKKLVDPMLMYFRHHQLVREMLDRNYNHKSELPLINYKDVPYDIRIDLDKNLLDLLSRCEECRKRYEEMRK